MSSDTPNSDDGLGNVLARGYNGRLVHILPKGEVAQGHGASAFCGCRPKRWRYVSRDERGSFRECWQCVEEYLDHVPVLEVHVSRDKVWFTTEGGMPVKQRVTLRDATAEEAVPRRAPTGAQMEIELGNPGLTPWSTEEPPQPGLWEVSEREGGRARGLWWFGGVWWIMSSQPGLPGQGGMRHDDFARRFAWRGLAQRPEERYSCPPYDLRTVPQGCELEVFVPLAPRRPVTH